MPIMLLLVRGHGFVPIARANAMTSNDEERPGETRVRPVSDDEPWTPDAPEADAEPDDIQSIDIRARRRTVRLQ